MTVGLQQVSAYLGTHVAIYIKFNNTAFLVKKLEKTLLWDY